MKKAGKITRAFVEGKVIFKTYQKTLKKLDCCIGYSARKRYGKKVTVNPKQVFFYTFQGMYTCNPKYISEELEKRAPDVKIVWALLNPKSLPTSKRNKNIVAYNYNFFECFEAAAQSKIIITNSTVGDKNYLYPVKKDQVLVETWHGSLGIKKFDKKSYKSSRDWPRAMEKTAKNTSYCISNSAFEDEVYKDTFWDKHGEIVRLGHARTDILFDKGPLREKFYNRLISKFNLPKDQDIHFVLYGPTFRDDHGFGAYSIDFNGVLDALGERFGGKWYMLLKYHPTVLLEESVKNKINSERVLNVSSYVDIQELMLVADAGISDYSSWMFDYMLRRKPIFVYASDYEKYKFERTFYYPLESTPFPMGKNNKELIKNIKEFNEEKYIEETDRFIEEKGCVDDGESAKRAVDLILKILEENKN